MSEFHTIHDDNVFMISGRAFRHPGLPALSIAAECLHVQRKHCLYAPTYFKLVLPSAVFKLIKDKWLPRV